MSSKHDAAATTVVAREPPPRPIVEPFQIIEPPEHAQYRHTTPLQSVKQFLRRGYRYSATSDTPYLSRPLTILFALASGFTSANLSYSQPILSILAADFKVSQSQIANVPALAQAGNAVGLLMILPLADFFPRRMFTLTLISLTAVLWFGLCISEDFTSFMALTFLSALFTPVTQLFLPLVSELSMSSNRAFNLSIMSTGPTLGIFLGRTISGLIAEHSTWRNVYWLGLALQSVILVLLLIFMPEYGSLNSTPIKELVATYPKVIWSVIALYYKHPLLIQAGLMSFSTFFTVASFWTTITFLLSGPLYNYNSGQIGLLGLIGIGSMLAAPLCSKYIIQPLGEPLYSAGIAKFISLCGITVGTFLGTHSIAGPIVEALLLDVGLVVLQISNRVALHSLEPQMRNRINTAFVLILYLGQFVGTKVGSVVYQNYGGWIPTGAVNIALIVVGFLVIGLRGPNENGWIGWRGGWKSKSK